MNKRTVQKWFWLWEFEKEEEWLNEMAQGGWALASVSFASYTFEACEPGAYIIRLEARNSDMDYLKFMGEAGAEYLGRVFKWLYFRRRTELGPFELFPNADSRLEHLSGIARMLKFIGIGNCLIGLGNSLANHFGWINLLVAALAAYALGRIHGKMEALERQREQKQLEAHRE